MYALHLNAVPDETNEEYPPGQPCPIFMIVNVASEDGAVERAEQVLREKHWQDIRLRYIERVPAEKESADNPITDYTIYVFSEAEKNRLQKFSDEAKALYGRLADPEE
jgi:hypothetical protein